MTIHSMYIFDRHCECIYYQDWQRTRPIIPPQTSINFKPGVARYTQTAGGPSSSTSSQVPPRMVLDGHSGRLIAVGGPDAPGKDAATNPSQGAPSRSSRGLPFDEEAKLVYGVVLSLRNIVKKLSGRDENFIAYRTSAYKLHLYETMSGYKFVLLSDPLAESLRFVLRQIYTGPFLDFVVRNPMVKMDDRERGVDNDLFRSAVDRYMRGLTIFGG